MNPAQEDSHLIVFGAGGHGREIGWFASEADPLLVIHFVVDDPKYLGADDVHLLKDLAFTGNAKYVIALGDPNARQHATRHFTGLGRPLSAATIVHPSAVLAPNVSIAPGCVIGAGAVISHNVRLGGHSHVNIGATLSHDVAIGRFATIAPGVHIAGNVNVGDGVFIGIGAVVINGSAGVPLTIGDGAFIAAGSCVTRDVDAGSTVVGVPAKRIR